MAKVKCEYCGAFIEDTEEKCPNCGAVNEHHKRIADDTPRTIAGLQKWYTDHHLPPENVTRFFIGKDVKEVKAFGIFQNKKGQFVVYKNKANGARAIRYQGTDEAYAVNELYLKLKEVILAQKSNNLKKQSGSSEATTRSAPAAESTTKKKKHPLLLILLLIWSPVLIALIIFGITSIVAKVRPEVGYYDYEDKLYYYAGPTNDKQEEWWVYDGNAWGLLEETVPQHKYPGNMAKKNLSSILSFTCTHTEYSDIPEIEKDRAFIDAGHHNTSPNLYYKKDDTLLYYLGSGPSQGWYSYDDSNDGSWSYYCSDDDKEKLGDELWYNSENAVIGSQWDVYDFSTGEPWEIAVFENTEFYQEYRDYNNNNNNDNDNDYDWDYGGDWDADVGGDWDSDW